MTLAQPAKAQQPTYVGITTEEFNYFASTQKNSNWCWAACIQMIFNYYGLEVTQEDIVKRSFRLEEATDLPNVIGDPDAINASLNDWNLDESGKPYHVESVLRWGPPSPKYLIDELTAKRPVMIGYRSGHNSGHAVVITAASYTPSPNGPIIQTLVVRDPMPENSFRGSAGRIEYPGRYFARFIQAHWFIRVE